MRTGLILLACLSLLDVLSTGAGLSARLRGHIPLARGEHS